MPNLLPAGGAGLPNLLPTGGAGLPNLQPTSGSLLARGAQNPSVSADGRYVAFSSGWKLVPADTNPNVDVYVRGAYSFDLASATDEKNTFSAQYVEFGGALE